jgi:hypothetical protein
MMTERSVLAMEVKPAHVCCGGGRVYVVCAIHSLNMFDVCDTVRKLDTKAIGSKLLIKATYILAVCEHIYLI